MNLMNFARNTLQHVGINTVRFITHQGFTAQFEQNALETDIVILH
jgi:hypothetical protein